MLAVLLCNLAVVYPDIPQHIDTRVTPIGGTKVQMAPNAFVRAQARYSATVFQILCVHPQLTLAELEDLKAFIEENKRKEVTWTAAESGDVYERCVFAGANALDWRIQKVLPGGVAVFRVEVRMLTSVA
jgi:hypothetical protein